MAILKGLAVSAVLVLSISGAAACDDYEDQMALAAAIDAAKLAKAQSSQPAMAADAAAQTASPLEGTSLASVDAKPTPATDTVSR
jgi:hypothetical protein